MKLIPRKMDNVDLKCLNKQLQDITKTPHINWLKTMKQLNFKLSPVNTVYTLYNLCELYMIGAKKAKCTAYKSGLKREGEKYFFRYLKAYPELLQFTCAFLTPKSIQELFKNVAIYNETIKVTYEKKVRKQ